MRIISFSPTGNTSRILRRIAEGYGAGEVSWVDMTAADFGSGDSACCREFTLIGVPVYRGRVPVVAAERLRQVCGGSSLAGLVVSYGNRDYEDALLELSDIARKQGFQPVAAGAFVGEHSYSTQDLPLAVGRPDTTDLDAAHAFGRAIRTKLDQGQVEPLDEGAIPGNRPYRDHGELGSRPPVTDGDICSLCGECVTVCPTAAISVDEEEERVVTSIRDCIMCCACTRACPTGARQMKDPHVEKIRSMLREKTANRREAEVFI